MRVTCSIISIALLLILPLNAAESNRQSSQAVIVAVGAPGLDGYAAEFAESVDQWRQACSTGAVRLTVIGLGQEQDLADYELLKQALAREAENEPAALWLVLIGHGTFDGRSAKFNLRGPDVSAAELSLWLAPVVSPLAVINTTASSAPFLKELSAPDRIVITATKSGFEQNYTRFGRFFSAAVADSEADLDKDGQTSLLEAFLAASHRVEQSYAAAAELATEHALLDDNGDGLGTRADWFRGIQPVRKPADGSELDGYRAHQFHLVYSSEELEMPPDLRDKRDDLELQVMKLRDNKDSMSEAEYFEQLEDLLGRIARIYEEPNEPGSE